MASQEAPAGFVPDAPAAAAPAGFIADEPAATFRQSDTTPNELDPNTIKSLATHLWDGINPVKIGAMLPWPKLLGGSGLDNPLNPGKIVRDLALVKKDASARLASGDYVGAFAKYVESVIPVLGPMLSQQGDRWQSGHYMAALGDSLALAANVAAGKVGGELLADQYPLAATAAPGAPKPPTGPGAGAIQFAQDRGIPIDAATASDNWALKATQAVADKTLGGSMVATPARAATAAAMERTAGALADDVHGVPAVPETAGASLRDALTAKIAGHQAEANTAYDTIRQAEQDPANRMSMPNTVKAPVDAVAPRVVGELRRIYHEMDSIRYVKNNFNKIETRHGGDFEVGGGSAGASVYDDILGNLSQGSNPTRGEVAHDIENYLGGGKLTANARAALGVAEERAQMGTGARVTVNAPGLPPSARDILTRAETVRQAGQDMGFPVQLEPVKTALKPLADQLKRQMPVTQQAANPGLHAIQNILDGPDYAPLSQVDRDLSTIKALARANGGVAKVAVAKLEAAVKEAAANGGPEIVKALEQGRKATVSKYAAQDVLDMLHAEPVKAIRQLTAPKDASIQALRTVVNQAPAQAPVIARAFLEDLLAKPNRVAEWGKVGRETRAILFPKAGLSQALDQFFQLQDRISKTNINPSGSGHTASMTAQAVLVGASPVYAGLTQLGAAGTAALLRYPPVVRALTRGLSLPSTAPVAAQTAAYANVVQAVKAAGLPASAWPKAAEAQPDIAGR